MSDHAELLNLIKQYEEVLRQFADESNWKIAFDINEDLGCHQEVPAFLNGGIEPWKLAQQVMLKKA